MWGCRPVLRGAQARFRLTAECTEFGVGAIARLGKAFVVWTPYVLQDKTKQENSCHLPAPGSSRSKRNLWLSFSGCKENAIITTLGG